MARKQICVTIPEECLKWVDKQVEDRTYGNRSHAIEVIILNAMKTGMTKK